MTDFDYELDLDEIALLLEDLSADEGSGASQGLRPFIAPEGRLAFSIQLWAALERSTVPTSSEREELLAAWCPGIGTSLSAGHVPEP